MDYSAIVNALRVRVQKIETAIAELEELTVPNSANSALLEALKVPTRRGRKSMSAEEAQQVSERMKRYWAGRRKP